LEIIMKKAIFAGSRLKIVRARRHAEELASEIEKYVSRDPFAAFVERDKVTGKANYTWRGREDIPEELSAIFGDAIHNLRTSLDILANDLVASSGVTATKVYFPFSDSEEGLTSQINSKMKGASKDIIDIVRSFRPYRGGNEILRAMHDLDIKDKHVSILTAHAAISIFPKFKRIANTNPAAPISYEADFEGTPTVVIDMTGFLIPDNIEVVGKVRDSGPIVLVIAPGFPLAGSPVIRTLEEMISMTESVVDAFETHCVGS